MKTTTNGSENEAQVTEAVTPPRVVVKKAKAQVAKTRGATTGPWTFPKNTLEDAIVVAKAIEDKNAGNPMRLDMLVRALGFRQTNDWRFLNLVRSATRYGLVSAGGTGASTVASLEQIGRDIVAPGSPDQRQTALFEAFRHVSDFEKVETFYKGKNFLKMSSSKTRSCVISPFREIALRHLFKSSPRILIT